MFPVAVNVKQLVAFPIYTCIKINCVLLGLNICINHFDRCILLT